MFVGSPFSLILGRLLSLFLRRILLHFHLLSMLIRLYLFLSILVLLHLFRLLVLLHLLRLSVLLHLLSMLHLLHLLRLFVLLFISLCWTHLILVALWWRNLSLGILRLLWIFLLFWLRLTFNDILYLLISQLFWFHNRKRRNDLNLTFWMKIIYLFCIFGSWCNLYFLLHLTIFPILFLSCFPYSHFATYGLISWKTDSGHN